MHKDEFYIGYQDETPLRIKKFRRLNIACIATIIILMAVVFSWNQNQFKNSTFELDEITEVEGFLYARPVPMLRMKTGKSMKNIVLLGFGKLGAEAKLKELKDQLGESIEGKKMKIKGSLIYYNGKTFMQLEPDIRGTFTPLSGEDGRRKFTNDTPSYFEGEIVDPKCFFGVMKPGRGKIHRSCAARCISGGIPPVFVSMNEQGNEEYFLMLDGKGKPLNESIIAYIGKPLKIKAQRMEMDDWQFLNLDPSNAIEVLEGNSRIYTSK